MTMEDKKKPLERSGNITVWQAKELKNGKKVYKVSFENAAQQRTYVSVFANIAGHELKPDEILALAEGKNVRIVDQNLYGPRVCSIVNRGIEIKITQQEERFYENHKMILGVAFHKLNNEGKMFGYLCNGISFYVETEDLNSKRSIYLTPQDCFKLLDGLPVTKDGNEAFLKYIDEVRPPGSNGSIDETKIYKTARLSITKQINEQNFYLRNDIELIEPVETKEE